MKRQTVVKMICETGISRELLDSEEVRKIAEEWNFPLPLSALLLNRGYRTKEEITAFLYPSVGELPSPFLLKDMDKAVARILPALEGKEKILIYGDYDADGITATALLWSYLKSKGVTADCRIPDRFSEGYGIREEALSEAKDRGIQLILTVDTGITACKELSKASSLGLDVVVTDHHECKSTLPECYAVVNPMRPDCSYPFKGLAGVGVAYKLISALECRLTDEDEKTVNERLLSQYGDFLTLGTVADVMPLTKENRIYVKEGLKLLDTGVHPGLSALLRLAQGEKRMKSACTVTTVGYMLAPRINAAGRMGSAESALRLLQTESPSEGEALGQFLCSCNLQRQLEEAKIYKEAEELLHSDESYKNDRILLLWKEGWHQGVIGIVASRIAERYGKPTILVSLEGEEGKGSGRSPEGCNLVELLKENEGLLLRYGGHELAAGLSVKRELLPTLRLALNALKAGKTVGTEKVFKAELELKPAEMTLRLASALSALEPCGNGNEAPVFLLRDAEIYGIQPLSEGKHTKLILEREGLRFAALLFGQPTALLPYSEGEKLDLLFNLSVNEYKGQGSVQLLIKNADLAASSKKKREAEKEEFLAFCREDGKSAQSCVPDRLDFTRLYRFLVQQNGQKRNALSLDWILSNTGIENPTILRIALEVFRETGLLIFRYAEEDWRVVEFSLPRNTQKTDLEQSALLRRLKG